MADALSPRSRDRSGERGSYSISSGVWWRAWETTPPLVVPAEPARVVRASAKCSAREKTGGC